MVPSMSYCLKDIAISDIDIQDETYRISTPTNPERLLESIRLVGVINPPALKAQQGQFVIITGFQRVEAARRLGFAGMPARLFPENAALLDCVRLAIADNLVQRELNLVELARCIAMLSRCIGDPALVSVEARRLGLPGDRHFLQQLSEIEQFPEMIKAGLSEGRLSLNIAWELVRLGYEPADRLASLFRELKINQNKQKEIVTHLKEIAIRESQTVQTVINDLGLDQILSGPTRSNQQKTETIRSTLRKCRFPHLWEAQEQSKQALKRLKLDKTIQIQPADYFEDTSVTLKLAFKTKNELKQHIAHLERILTDPDLDQLLKR